MKKTLPIFAVTAMFFFAACEDDRKEGKQDKTIGALTISDATPNPGGLLAIQYDPKTAIVESPKAYFYYLVQDELYAKDLGLTDSMKIWKANVSIPDSATAIGFNFEVDGEFDLNNKKGYVLPLYTKEGKPVAGGNSSLAYFYSRFGENIGLEIGQDSIVTWIQGDIEKHPELQTQWDIFYAKAFFDANAEKGEKYVNERIDYYAKKENLSEEAYSNLIDIYRILDNEGKIDPLKNVAVEAYPKGEIAALNYLQDFHQADLAQKGKMVEEFDSLFKDEEQIKNRMLRILANTYVQNSEWEKFKETASQISYKSSLAGLYNNLAWSMAEKGENLETASEISKKSLELMSSAKENPANKPNWQTENQYKDRLEREFKMYADTYAFILFKQGEKEEALKYQKMALGESAGADVNERYVQYLLATGNVEEAKETASVFIKENKATDKVKTYFKEAFLKTGGTEKEFDKKLTGLEKIAKEKALDELKKEMLNEPAPAFTLKDLKGNEISLSSLQGKTIILDFWATWCGPCKASFPGMQKAVEKHKGNPNVAFFFVNTWEQAENRKEKVAGFIERNGYDFHVLLDEKKEKTPNEFVVVEEFGISGIPTKIIIGPDGNIKFRKVGYGGNNAKMLQEIEMMIALSKS